MEQTASMPTEPSTGNMIDGQSSDISRGILRMNTNSLLFPRNNLIDGASNNQADGVQEV